MTENNFISSVVVDTIFEVNDYSASFIVFYGLFFVSVLLIMDGLIRGYHTSPKRSASGPSLSPFSTSPNQLQEVTSSANATLFDQTKISPMRGRSVKEYDEQLTALKKENFNLKLRIYFLEERMGSNFRVEDKDNILRKNIEYQVDIETLRRELDEKQDLLCQAVKALELEDAEHKRILASKDLQLVHLNERIESLEHELNSVINTNTELTEKNERLLEDSTRFCTEVYGIQTDNKEELNILKVKIADLEDQLNEEKEHNSILENDVRDIDCLHLRCENLESELTDKNKKIETLSTELESNGHIVSSCNLRIRTLEDILTSKNSDIKFKDKEITHRDRLIQDQAVEIDELRRLVEEGNVLCDKEQRQTENLKSAVMSRDNTIADLESKLEKCKSVIRNLEARLESISHENKRQKDELLTIKQQRRNSDKHKYQESSKHPGSPRSTTSSTSTISNSNFTEITEVDKNKITKLQEENKKAFSLIQTLVSHSKYLEKLKVQHEASISEKDNEILQLKKEKYLQLSGSPRTAANTENSTEETNENKNLEESKLDMTTLEWAKQVEELMEIIQEKEEELQIYKEKCDKTTIVLEERDNRIIELEKEVLDLKSELNAANKQIDEFETEKHEFNEKPSSWMRVTEEKDKKIEQLESEVRKHTFNLQGIVNNELWDKNREIEKLQNRFTEKLRLKDQEISELDKQMTAKDMQLQLLKDKISELGIQINLPRSLFTSKLSSELVSGKPEEISYLKEQLRASNEECKYLHKVVEELRQQLRNTPERDSDNKIVQLKEEHLKLQEEYENSEKMRFETMNLCSLLTTRLEELAHFLDSLLKHKSVLGMLGSKQRSAIKQAIDQSLDLSKSLSVSIMNEDQSLAQLSSLTGLLNTTSTSVNASMFESWREDENEPRTNASLTYNSHLNRHRGDGYHNNVVIEQTEIINILRAQIETMKKEIELRDLEICKHNADNIVSSDAQQSLKNDNDLVEAIIDLQSKSTPNAITDILSPEKIYQDLIANKSCPTLRSLSIDNHSESEAWSEPDRCVSQARMGLDSETLKNTSSGNLNRSRSNKSASTDGASSASTENEMRGINKTPSKRGSGSLETRHTVSLLQENLSLLENKLKEKENEILSLKTAILELDNKSLELKLNMTGEIAKLRNEKMDVEKLLKDTEEKIKNVDVHSDEILSKIECIEEERDNALREAEKAASLVEVLKLKTVELEKVIKENQLEYETKIKESDEKWVTCIEKVEQEADLKLKEIEDATNELKKQYETEWIRKSDIAQELDSMKQLLKTAENKISLMETTELELKKKYTESEDSYREKIVSLKRELNESALCASQVALERTKINNEKLKLEAEIRKLEIRENIKCNELDEKEKEFINMKNNLQKQIAVAEAQKSCLQLKVSELESANAELHNRVIKLQTSENNSTQSSSSTSVLKISDLVTNFKAYGKHSLGSQFMRQKSDMSGYASEDVLTDENDGGVFNRTAPHAFHWLNTSNVNITQPDVTDARNVANSSPDLGIESDQGRFSSLETNITTNTRPLLQTLELTATMNNMLSNEQLDNVGHYCNIPVHKSLEKDNLELKKIISKLEVGLEKTTSELSKINKTKKQVEKGICKQIHKTSLVLRQARANLDSGSENENKRK